MKPCQFFKLSASIALLALLFCPVTGLASVRLYL